MSLQASSEGEGSILWIRDLSDTPEITLSPSIEEEQLHVKIKNKVQAKSRRQ